MPELVWLIPLLPMLAALWIGLGYLAGWNRGEPGERQTARAAVWASLLSLLLILVLDIQALLTAPQGQVVAGQWLASGSYRVLISFSLDALGLSMATLVALLCLLSIRFSVNYMHREAGFQRFFMVMSLFTGAMLLIVMAGNAVLAFVGWELAGVSSYLLIGYAFDRTTATVNANRAFVTNRIGDAGFVLGIALSFGWLGGVEWPQIKGGIGGLETLTAGLVGLGFLLAALAKSAQVPFSPWISRALEGPTPSSAVFYGAVMVHAGVYLVIRLESLFIQAPLLMVMMGLLGLLTALYGWLCGLVQTDVKSSLMFSTIAQVGLMFLECGLGWFDLAAWHLALRAVWRAYQFLHAPALMQLVTRPARPGPRRPGCGGSRNCMPRPCSASGTAAGTPTLPRLRSGQRQHAVCGAAAADRTLRLSCGGGWTGDSLRAAQRPAHPAGGAADQSASPARLRRGQPHQCPGDRSVQPG